MIITQLNKLKLLYSKLGYNSWNINYGKLFTFAFVLHFQNSKLKTNQKLTKTVQY